MLIDDDDMNLREEEELEAAAVFDAPPSPSAASEPAEEEEDEASASASVTQDDFALMPHIVGLVQAHAAGGNGRGQMRALRRALRRAEGRLARVLEGADDPPDGEEAARQLRAREELLSRQPRKRRREPGVE